MPMISNNGQDSPEWVLPLFDYAHLPAGQIRDASEPFFKLAHQLKRDLPGNPELLVCLRALLAAKDAAVRCQVAALAGRS